MATFTYIQSEARLIEYILSREP